MRNEIDPHFEYAQALSGPVPDYLLEVERQTFLKTMAPQMLSGQLQGRLLSLLSKLRQPETILEVGAFTGYSALCLAEGLAPGGKLHTIEGNQEVAFLARQNFAASPFADSIELYTGQAMNLLPDLPPVFDLVFLDGDKRGYPEYFDLLIDRLSPGGLLLADNILWDGKVSTSGKKDLDAEALRAYNQLLADDDRVEVVVLPLRDGLSVARKTV
ncbi:O-methyltransferase [Neolewinella aurantiaca]|uniref:O-methyltransferase n=1 Tax=Neolewinella aurantiaca TaxID=2602767 RepID=A0A5C7FQW1_9BACT|nr:O-methyltransferase [Neolewinella aurantiaca]TXF87762.1 O-methyltransferase [Neolewinella aurantiaca]